MGFLKNNMHILTHREIINRLELTSKLVEKNTTVKKNVYYRRHQRKGKDWITTKISNDTLKHKCYFN